MVLVGSRTPSLIQGVSQQPDGIRLPSQAEKIDNGWGTPVDGLRKRPPTRHIAKLSAGNYGTPLMHVINRDPEERYVITVQPDGIEVWDVDGNSIFVKETADFEYLATRSSLVANMTTSETFPNGADWTHGAGAITPAASTVRGPLGWSTAMTVGSVLGVLDGSYGKVPEGSSTWIGATGDSTRVSCYFKRHTTNPADSVWLTLSDSTNIIAYRGQFDWDGTTWILGGTTEDSGIGAPMPTQTIETLNDGWFRASITVTLNGTGTASGDDLVAAFKVESDAAVEQRLYAWGYFLEFMVPEVDSGPSPYAEFAEDALKALTVQDQTYITNSTKVTAMEATVSAAPGQTGEGFVFVKSALPMSIYGARVKQGANDNSVYIATHTGDATATGQSVGFCGGGPNTNDTAGGQTNCTNGGGVWTTGAANLRLYPETSGIAAELGVLLAATTVAPTIEVIGSVIRLYDGTAFDIVMADTDRGKVAATAFMGSETGTGVDNITDLPLTCQHGFIVRIVGSLTEDKDDLWVKFVADDEDFGPGHWVESMPYSTVTTIDASTMPHKLTRKQDDISGTVTGTPFALYFDFEEIAYDLRAVGDTEANPDPSFIGETIQQTTFARNRLGFLTGQSIVLSEVGNYTNFFRTTIKQLLDADPIDTTVAHPSVSTMFQAMPFQRNVLLWSDRSQFVLEGEPTLTPASVSTKPIFGYEVLTTPLPQEQGKSVSFYSKQGDYSLVRELYTTTASADVFESEDITAQVPRYISGEIKDASASTLQDVLAVLSDGDRSVIYLYSYFWQGQQKAQSAWSRILLDTAAEVRGLGFIEDELFMLVQRADGLYIDSMRLSKGQVDTGLDFVLHLDRRVPNTLATVSPTYDSGTGLTTFTTPWTVPTGETVQVVSRDGSPTPGRQWTVDSASGTTVTVVGDASAEPVWLGFQYTFTYQFSEIWPQEQALNGGFTPGLQQPYTMVNGILLLEASAYLKVVVTPQNRDPQTNTFNGQIIGSGGWVIGTVPFTSGRFRFPVSAANTEVTIEIINDSPLPSNIVSAEWEIDLPSGSSNRRSGQL